MMAKFVFKFFKISSLYSIEHVSFCLFIWFLFLTKKVKSIGAGKLFENYSKKKMTVL